MNVYVTFSGANYDETTRRVVEDAPTFGVDTVLVYDDCWFMDHDFVKGQQNQWLLNHPKKRGLLWYVWKPLVILDALDRLNIGDVLLYTDADTYPIADLSPLFAIARRDDAMFFEASMWEQYQWCKQDCFMVMAQDEPRYHQAKAGCARFMLFQKGPWAARQFLYEWLTYCVNPLANTFDISHMALEPAGFIEHRCEQAILTNLCHKYGYKLHREACQAGDAFSNDRDLYPTLFHQDDINAHETAPVLGSRYRNV